MRSGLEAIVNYPLNDHQWLQAVLPIRDGRLGIRRVESLASFPYLASAASTLELQTAILAAVLAAPDQHQQFSTYWWDAETPCPRLCTPCPSDRASGTGL